jgi:hypothetical protein
MSSPFDSRNNESWGSTKMNKVRRRKTLDNIFEEVAEFASHHHLWGK